MTSGIYEIRNKQNGMMYIGRSKHVEKREWEHAYRLSKGIHENPRLQNAWNKYGESNFEFSILWEEDAENLIELEGMILEELFDDGVLYNCHKNSFGGGLGSKSSPEKIEKMRLVNARKTEKAKAKVFAALDWAVQNSATRDAALERFGCSWGSLKDHQPEWEAIHGPLGLPKRASGERSGMFKHGLSKELRRRRTPSEIAEKHRNHSISMTGDSNPMFGRQHSDEARRIQSEAAKRQAEDRRLAGYTMPTETRQKHSEALKGKPKSEEHRRNMAASQIGKLYKTPFGTFHTSKEAEEATGVKAATVMWRCKNNYQGVWGYAAIA